jgi:hypothetical protein
VKRALLRTALLLSATLSPAACDDARTIIAVYDPAQPDADAPDADAPDAEVPDAEAPDAEMPLPNAFFIEAESAALSGPFMVGSSDAASGGEFIVATESSSSPDGEPGAGRAVYDFELAEAGEYVIWGRIHSPDALSNRYWVSLDGSKWTLWRISTGEAWFWDDMHDDTNYGTPLTFALEAGAHRLELASAVTGAELDRLYVTARSDHPPGNDTPCNPPHSIEVQGACIRSCGSYGAVSCISAECMGLPELEAYDCPVCCLPP